MKALALLIALLIGMAGFVPAQAKTKSGGSGHSAGKRSHGHAKRGSHSSKSHAK
jgi:hypothetical protein